MSDPIEALILDLPETLAREPRGYTELMEAWRTSCPRLPVWEEANDRGFLCGITANPNEPLGDVKQQTRAVLAQIDALLRRAGTDKSRILTAQVWLTDMGDFADHNDAWNEWVDQDSPPARACLHSPQLWRPGLRVEIMVTAAR